MSIIELLTPELLELATIGYTACILNFCAKGVTYFPLILLYQLLHALKRFQTTLSKTAGSQFQYKRKTLGEGAQGISACSNASKSPRPASLLLKLQLEDNMVIHLHSAAHKYSRDSEYLTQAKTLCKKVEKKAAMEIHGLSLRTAETRNSANLNRIYQSANA